MICSVEGCGRKIHAHGFCGMHCERWKRHGDPLKTRWSPWGESAKFIEAAIHYRGDDCLIWPFQRDQMGHARVFWKGRKQRVARIICEAVHGKPRSRREATHSCGNGHRGCVNPRHLVWKTHKGNMEDMILHGRSNRGSRNPHAKLTEYDVQNIKRLALTESQTKIAQRYGVDPSMINHIVRGRHWGHI